MRCLTDAECNTWIEQQGLIAKPYGDWKGYPAMAAGRYHQFGFEADAFLAQALVVLASPFTEALLWVVDDGWEIPPIDTLVNVIRRSHGENRSWAETSAYLYFADSGTIFLNWEGTLLDSWTKNPNHTQAALLAEQHWGRKKSFAPRTTTLRLSRQRLGGESMSGNGGAGKQCILIVGGNTFGAGRGVGAD